MDESGKSDIVHLNVGGTRFTTSRATLTVIPDTFFTSLLSGRIARSVMLSSLLLKVIFEIVPELFKINWKVMGDS